MINKIRKMNQIELEKSEGANAPID